MGSTKKRPRALEEAARRRRNHEWDQPPRGPVVLVMVGVVRPRRNAQKPQRGDGRRYVRHAAFHALQPDIPEEIQRAILKRCEREGTYPDDIMREVFMRGWNVGPYCPHCGEKLGGSGR